jgi:hypothetical protein
MKCTNNEYLGHYPDFPKVHQDFGRESEVQERASHSFARQTGMRQNLEGFLLFAWLALRAKTPDNFKPRVSSCVTQMSHEALSLTG